MSSESLSLQTRIKMRDGNTIPQLGLGTYELHGKAAYSAVMMALEEGYRHIDTAEWYENEKECSQAVKDFCAKTSTPRSEIFYTTKLRTNKGISAATRAINQSLKDSGLGYIDLYLIHSPLGGPERRLESWKAALEAQKEGIVKSIGVSNYGIQHLQEMLDSGLPLPVVNQVDLHPFMSRAAVVELCRKHDIVLQAWAPLVRGLRFKHPTIQAIAQAHSRQPSQVLLRYCLQKGYIPLPKSSTRERIASNKELYDFELSEEEMERLYSLDEYLVTDWDVVDAD